MTTFKLHKSAHTGEYNTNFDHVICVEGITEQDITLTVEELIELSALFNIVVEESRLEQLEYLKAQKQRQLKSIQLIDQQIEGLTR